MRFPTIIFLAALPLVLTACPTQHSNSDDTTLASIDVDQNGIRDDIDEIIKSEYAFSAEQTKFAQAYARGAQKMITAVNPTTDEAVAMFDSQHKNGMCLRYATPGDGGNSANRIHAATTNTKARQEAYNNTANLAPAAYTLPKRKECAKIIPETTKATPEKPKKTEQPEKTSAAD